MAISNKKDLKFKNPVEKCSVSTTFNNYSESREPTRKQFTKIDWRLVSVNGDLVCGALHWHTRSENQ